MAVSGKEIGRLTIRVLPDVDRFRSQLKAQLESIKDQLKIPVSLDTDGLRSELSRAVKAAETGQKITVPVDIDKDRIGPVIGDALSGASKNLGRLRSDLGQALSVTGSLAAGLLKISAMAFAVAVGGAAVAAAWGAVSTALASIPALVSLIGVAGGAVALGMDGIKRAASSLKPEFDRLKASTSAAFERGLKPAMENVRALFPSLKRGFTGVADSLSYVATNVTAFLKEASSIERLDAVFANVQSAIRDLSPAISEAVLGFLDLASQKGAFDALTGAARTFATEFRNGVTSTITDGSLTRAFEGLGGILDSLAESLTGLVTNGIRLFANAAPGVERVIDSLNGFFDKFDYGRLGTAVGDVFSGIASSIDRIDPGTVERITVAFEDLGKTFQDPKFQDGLSGFIEGLPGLISTVGTLSKGIGDMGAAFGAVSGPISEVVDWFSRLEAIINPVQRLIKGFSGGALFEVPADSGIGRFVSTLQSVPTIIDGLTIVIETKLSQLPTRVGAILGGLGIIVSTKFEEMRNLAVSKALALVTTVITTFANLPTRAGAVLSGLGIIVSTTFESAKQAAVLKVAELVGTVVGFFSSLPGRASAVLAAIPIVVSSAFDNAKSAAASRVAGIVDNVVSGFNRARSSVESTVAGIVTSVVSGFSNARANAASSMAGLVTTVITKGGEAVGFMRSLPGRISSALGNLGSLLVGAGRALIDGLLAGIKSAVTGMLSYVGTIAGQIAARKGPISYDRRVLIPQGEALMLGLRRGLESGMAEVENQVRAFTRYFASLEFPAPVMAGGFGIDTSMPALEGVTRMSLDAMATSVADDDYGFRNEVRSGIADGLADWGVQIDENGLAKMVNKKNNRDARRR